MQIKVGNRLIGDDCPCYIIAEAGVNHNGNIKKAKLLIDIAKESGVDAVKFQTYITEELITKSLKQAKYQVENTGIKESQYEMLKRLELSFEQFDELKKYADKKEIIFLSTPDDEKSVDFLDELGVPLFKISSGELTNLYLIKKIAEKKKPIILSTGMARIKEIQDALNIIYKTGCKDIILLHCTSQYPTKLEDVNLKAMITLKKKFNTLIGYSDHTLGIKVPQYAVSLGACVIEKHFTFDKTAPGPDHVCSLNSQELKNMVDDIRITELILGSDIKEPTPKEILVSKVVRKTIVAKVNIQKGIIINRNMLAVKRSNGTLKPKEFKYLEGKVSLKDIKKNSPISENDVK